jgi:hypothetical protein
MVTERSRSGGPSGGGRRLGSLAAPLMAVFLAALSAGDLASSDEAINTNFGERLAVAVHAQPEHLGLDAVFAAEAAIIVGAGALERLAVARFGGGVASDGPGTEHSCDESECDFSSVVPPSANSLRLEPRGEFHSSVTIPYRAVRPFYARLAVPEHMHLSLMRRTLALE